MDLEARSMPPGIKASLLAKIREHRNDLNILKSEIKRLHSSNANVAERDKLLESGKADAMQVLSPSILSVDKQIDTYFLWGFIIHFSQL
jgi:hypothetical protein